MTTDEHGADESVHPEGHEPGDEFDDTSDNGESGTGRYLLAVAMLAVPSWLVYTGVKRLMERVFWPSWLETVTTVGAALVTFYIMLRLIPRRAGEEHPPADSEQSAE